MFVVVVIAYGLMFNISYCIINVTLLIIAPQLSSGWDQPVGSLVVTVKELLAKPQLIMDQWFHLDGASPDSQLLLRAELKVMTHETLRGRA